jgi:hypothetical protein
MSGIFLAHLLSTSGGVFLSNHGGRRDTMGGVEQSYWHNAAQATNLCLVHSSCFKMTKCLRSISLLASHVTYPGDQLRGTALVMSGTSGIAP